MTSIMGSAPSDASRDAPRAAEEKAEALGKSGERDEDAESDPAASVASETDKKASQESEPPQANGGGGGQDQTDEEEEDREEDGEEDGDSTPPRPKRTTRARLIKAAESDTESDRGGPRRRGRPRRPARGQSGTSPSDSGEKPKRQRGRPPRTKVATATTSEGKAVASKDAASDPADYVHVEVGDCVLLDSGDPDDHYVALVSSVQLSQSSDKPTGFTAQWYYKPDDIRDEVRASIPGGVLSNEVFLSPHKDKNSIDAVVGICNVVPHEEFTEMQLEIERGFREKSHRPHYVCRFKYYPSRSVKKALEQLNDEEIRGGLGPQKPKVGEEYQAAIPEMKTDKPTTVEEAIPWRLAAARGPDKSMQVWSRHAVENQELVFRQFRSLLDTIRFGVGNVVRLYRTGAKILGHVRCIVLKFDPSGAIEVCVSTGEKKVVLKTELCSPLSEDVAMKILYAARFNLSHAAHLCTKRIVDAQHRERDAFKQEILVFARLAADEKAKQTALEESSNRKRRK